MSCPAAFVEEMKQNQTFITQTHLDSNYEIRGSQGFWKYIILKRHWVLFTNRFSDYHGFFHGKHYIKLRLIRSRVFKKTIQKARSLVSAAITRLFWVPFCKDYLHRIASIFVLPIVSDWTNVFIVTWLCRRRTNLLTCICSWLVDKTLADKQWGFVYTHIQTKHKLTH